MGKIVRATTDVSGVRVGQVTLREGDRVREILARYGIKPK